MAALTAEQVAQIAAQAGFTGRELIYMVAIAKRESGYKPDAHRTDSDRSKNLGDRGLFQINSANDKTLINAGIIKNRTDLYDPVTNARAAFYLAGGRYGANGQPIQPAKGYNLNPWAAVAGKGWSAGGNPLAGTNVGAAQAAVNNASSQGLIGKPYSGPGGTGQGGASTYNVANYSGSAGTPDPPQGGPKLVAAEERDLFNKYMKSLPDDKQKALIEDLKKQRTLPEVAAWMSQQAPEVNRYVNYLATLDASGQYQEKNLLVAPDPAGNKEMTDLLNTFGVSYPNAPNPTPALLAFLKGIGLNLSTAEDVKRRALERIGASTSDAMADIDRTAGRAKQNLTADLVRRNVLSSGESNTRYARGEEDVANQRSDVQRTSTNAADAIESTYSQARDLARQQALDRIINAEQSQAADKASSAAQVDATRAQQQAADQAWERQKAAQDAAIKAQEDAMAKYAQQGSAV